MQKDLTVAPPRRINDKQEHGFYIFWNQSTWRREKVCTFPDLNFLLAKLTFDFAQRDFLLTYDHLDQSHGGAGVGQ